MIETRSFVCGRNNPTMDSGKPTLLKNTRAKSIDIEVEPFPLREDPAPNAQKKVGGKD